MEITDYTKEFDIPSCGLHCHVACIRFSSPKIYSALLPVQPAVVK